MKLSPLKNSIKKDEEEEERKWREEEEEEEEKEEERKRKCGDAVKPLLSDSQKRGKGKY